MSRDIGIRYNDEGEGGVWMFFDICLGSEGGVLNLTETYLFLKCVA